MNEITNIQKNKVISTYIVLILGLFLFLSLYISTSSQIYTIFLITLIGMFFISIIAFSKNFFNPFYFFFIYSFLGFIDITMVSLGFRDTLIPISTSAYDKSLLIMLIWLLTFSFGYWIAFKRINIKRFFKNYNLKLQAEINPWVIFILCGTIFMFSFSSTLRSSMSLGGIVEGMSGGGAAFADQGYLLALLGFAGILPVMALYSGKKFRAIIYCLIVFIGILLTGRRSMAILTAFLPFLVYWNMRVKQIKFLHIALLTIPLIVIVMYIGAIRTAENPNFSLSNTDNQALEQLVTLGRYNGYGDNIPALVDKIDSETIQLQKFNYSLRGVEYFIPRSLWNDKPLVHSSQIVSDLVFFAGDTGRPVNAYGWAYFNFGLLGVILSGLITGAIVSCVYKIVLNRKSVILISMYALLILPLLEVFQPEAQMKIILFAVILKTLEFISKKGRFRRTSLRRNSVERIA
ncbi:O-antigen polymerase [Jeotgalibacillus proteolyticus]|uniref:Oligosaccharide repeat unit polymerase n=1 Tax=Jeotgalibacillus proteolyticus TaxID=2082395 RepID=A0A2S5G924_9BACL|nr:O-antigen polymerase [Jeotgalibacillus proteolyticus]PPA69500.1 hypothetical protein C4B60_13180 [Jeotgalibacillus proteolyticus]